MKFEIREEFYLDGKQIKIISGSVHYFRSPEESWNDTLYKLKALGCNAVELYVPWNLHEPVEGKYDFSGNLNVLKFLQIAQSHGLLAIVRMGPYMCAEADFGGLPWWLLTKKLRIRCNDELYLSLVKNYFERLVDELRPMFLEHGGNIIMGQLENEFGSYSNDKEYLYKLYAIIKQTEFSPSLVTSDGAWGNMLENGTMYKELGLLPTLNFGSNASVHFKTLQKYIGKSKVPYMCMEFWCGWFTSWGHPKINTTSVEDVANELDKVLQLGSVNFYMFHGGTNFANISGANKTLKEGYKPHITSYDYDALLDERGNITEKYIKCREVIAKYVDLAPLDVEYIPTRAYGKVEYCGSRPLVDETKFEIVRSSMPQSIEELGYGYGYINYKLELKSLRSLNRLDIQNITDRAYLKINGNIIQTLEGADNYHLNLDLDFTEDPVLELLLECNPRVNYGQFLENGKKGLLGGIFVNGHFFATGYDHLKVDINSNQFLTGEFEYNKDIAQHISKFKIIIEDCVDTYIDTKKLGKGYIIVNDHNIGRFWNVGPQYKLFVPKSFLKPGINNIYVVDTEMKPIEFELIG